MSPILRRAVYPVMSSTGVFSRSLRSGEVCVLTYHGVIPKGFTSQGSPIDDTLITADRLRTQMRFLKSKYHVITPETFRAWCNDQSGVPDRAVLLTCDDGFLNVLTEMLPILHDERIECLFFVTGASTDDGPAYLWYEQLFQMLRAAEPEKVAVVCGNQYKAKPERSLNRCCHSLLHEFSRLACHDRRDALDELQSRLKLSDNWPPQNGSAMERRYRLLTRSELQQLVSAGMSIGAHTMSHPVLSEMTIEMVEHELRESKSRLESVLQQPVWALAYPFGDEQSAGQREAEIAENAGYSCAFMNCGGGVFGRTTPKFKLPRTHVTSRMEIPELEARLTGFFEPIRKRIWAAKAAGKES